MITVKTRKPSLRTLASDKLTELEQFAIKSTTFRKMITQIYKSALYKFFSKRIQQFKDFKLEEFVKKYPVPHHVAVIMDGNRRFAQSLDLTPEAGHYFGKDKIKELLEWCMELNIKILTIYAFSTENFKRSNQEVQTLMNLCTQELQKAKSDSRIHKNKVRVRILGQIDKLPSETKESAQYIMDSTKEYDNYMFNVALAYGGREELLQAIQQISSEVKQGKITVDDISENMVSSYLYTNGLPDPDLILRTSGEERISNFLLWQLAYSELYFADIYWPALQKRDFLQAIQTYQHRQRRYGK